MITEKPSSYELNEKLYEAITDEKLDYATIEELLVAGADPLGERNEDHETPLDGLFTEAGSISEYAPGFTDQLPKIMKLFIDYGFDCRRIEPADGDEDDRHLEMWGLVFSSSKGALETMKLMIENGLRVSAMEDYISHFFTDAAMCDGCEIDEDYEEYLTWALKTIMLCASYPHVLEQSAYIRQCIEIDTLNRNRYDVTKFREYDNYVYSYDLSSLTNRPYGLQGAMVAIREKGSTHVKWELSI